MNSKAQAPCREGLLPVLISVNNSADHPFRTLLPEVPRAGQPMPKQFGKWPDAARIRKGDNHHHPERSNSLQGKETSEGSDNNSNDNNSNQHNDANGESSGNEGGGQCNQEEVESNDQATSPMLGPRLDVGKKDDQDGEECCGSASTGSTGTNEDASAARTASLLTAGSENAQPDLSKPEHPDSQPSDSSDNNLLLSDRPSLTPMSPHDFDVRALFGDVPGQLETREGASGQQKSDLTQEKDWQEQAPDDELAHRSIKIPMASESKYCCPNPCEWNVALLEDSAEHRAKWAVTLTTLRSLLQLGPDAGWADIFEACETLCVRAGKIPLESVERDLKMVQQSETRIVQLEDQVRSQSAHINDLKELMHSIQSTLDTTAGQYEAQVRKSEQYVAEINELERWCMQLQTSLTEKELQHAALRSQYEELQSEVEEQRATVSNTELKCREQSLLVGEYEAELSKKTKDLDALIAELERTRNDCLEQAKQATEARERHLMEINVLEVELKEKSELVQNYSEKLLAYEVSARRRLSYRSPPSVNHEDHHAANATTPIQGQAPAATTGPQSSPKVQTHAHPHAQSHSPKAISPKRPGRAGSACFQQMGSPTAGRNVSAPGSAANSATSTPLLSYRSIAKSQVTLGSPTKSMTDEERHRFLAHFPMAMRTERQIRTHDRLMTQAPAHHRPPTQA